MKIALNTPGNYEFNSPIEGMPEGGLSTLESVVRWGTTVLVIISVILALFFLIWGGIQWITSGGNKEKVQAAQKKIVFAVVGLVIVIASFMIVSIVSGLFDVDFFG